MSATETKTETDWKKELAEISRRAYRAGLIDGIREYARWKNGTQVVGIQERPIQEVIDKHVPKMISRKADFF